MILLASLLIRLSRNRNRNLCILRPRELARFDGYRSRLPFRLGPNFKFCDRFQPSPHSLKNYDDPNNASELPGSQTRSHYCFLRSLRQTRCRQGEPFERYFLVNLLMIFVTIHSTVLVFLHGECRLHNGLKTREFSQQPVKKNISSPNC